MPLPDAKGGTGFKHLNTNDKMLLATYESNTEAATCRFDSTGMNAEVARAGFQMFGGCGFTKELAADASRYKVEEFCRDSKTTEICEGAIGIQEHLVARKISGPNVAG